MMCYRVYGDLCMAGGYRFTGTDTRRSVIYTIASCEVHIFAWADACYDVMPQVRVSAFGGRIIY